MRSNLAGESFSATNEAAMMESKVCCIPRVLLRADNGIRLIEL